MLRLCPDQRVERTTPQGVRQVYRWVNGLHYTDSDGREWTFNAIECTETNKEGEKTEWSWVTSLEVNHQTVVEVATNGGRERWRTENEGFNTQKNSGLNLEHAYSHTCWAAYYFLLQIAHLLLQLVEKGSLLRQLAKEQGKRTAVELFGSLKNMAQRLLESLRYRHWPDEVFDPTGSRLDPDPDRQQLAVGGGWVCSRLGRVRSGSGGGRTRSDLRARPPMAFSGPVGPPALAPPPGLGRGANFSGLAKAVGS